MSHSSSDDNFGGPDEKKFFMLNELKAQQAEIDNTYPDGKLAEHDEGALAFAVGLVANKVVVNFAKPTQSLGMTPDQAIELARLLVKRASFAKGEPVTLVLGEDG